MDRRQFTDAIKFFTLARHFYEDLGDSLVAEECTFAIALAQRIMSDAGRRSQRKNESAKEPAPPIATSPIKVVYDPATNESMSA
jgi:hypothetical protein